MIKQGCLMSAAYHVISIICKLCFAVINFLSLENMISGQRTNRRAMANVTLHHGH